MVRRWYRLHPEDEDPRRLLDPSEQYSEPWGEDDAPPRDGVSVFPDEDALYRYMLDRDADVSGSVLVELEGEPSPDEDFDSEDGAELVHPTRIVDVRPPDRRRIARLRDG